jgi:hypothetical protein
VFGFQASQARGAADSARETAVAAQATAVAAKRQTEAQLNVTEAQRLAFAASSLPANQGEISMLIAIEALHLDENAVTYQIMQDRLLAFPYATTRLSGHTGPVYRAVFSPDGTRILTASDDKTARLWDTSDTLLATLHGHTGSVVSAVFSPDGRRILTASADRTARQYAVRSNDMLAIAECRVGRGLTAEEIQQFNVPTPLRFDYATRQCPAVIGK